MPLFEPMRLHPGGLAGANPGTSRIDEVFRFFCESLFRAQFLGDPIEPDDALLALLHHLTLGIVGVLVKLFMLTQYRALSVGLERLSPELLQSTYADCFGLLHPHLEVLRSGRTFDGNAFARDIENFGAAMDRDQGVAARSVSQAAPGRAPAPQGPSAAVPAGRRAANSAPDGGGQPSTAPGAKPRPKRRKASASSCLLERVVENGTQDGLSAHQALARAGFIRPLGEEVLAG